MCDPLDVYVLIANCFCLIEYIAAQPPFMSRIMSAPPLTDFSVDI